MNAHPSAREVSSLCSEASPSDPIWRTPIWSCVDRSSEPKAACVLGDQQPLLIWISVEEKPADGEYLTVHALLWGSERIWFHKISNVQMWSFCHLFRNLCLRSPTHWPWRMRRFQTSSALSSRTSTTWRYRVTDPFNSQFGSCPLSMCSSSFSGEMATSHFDLIYQANSNRVQDDMQSEFTALHSVLDEMKEKMLTRIKQERASRTYELQVLTALFVFTISMNVWKMQLFRTTWKTFGIFVSYHIVIAKWIVCFASNWKPKMWFQSTNW